MAYSSIILYSNAKMLGYETEALATEAEADTKAFSVETEAKTKTFSLEAEARPRRLKFQPRRDRAVSTAPRDGLETEASRPRPHPCNFSKSRIPDLIISLWDELIYDWSDGHLFKLKYAC